MARFGQADWQSIFGEIERDEAFYGLPERRDRSVILSSFNIRSLSSGKTRGPGGKKGRTQGAWDLLAKYASRCDLLAIQEVGDNLDGVRRLKTSLDEPEKYGMVVSDVTGSIPGADTSHERLAFLFRWDRIERSEMASDIGYDRRAVLETVFKKRRAFEADFKRRDEDLEDYRRKLAEFKAGLRDSRPDKPAFVLSSFLTFMRAPHTVSFRVLGRAGAASLDFHAINAHLLYGHRDRSAEERRMEFEALIKWLLARTKQHKRMYYETMILFGDLNLEFERTISGRDEINQIIKDLNDKVGAGFKVNFPFLSVHPARGPAPGGDGRGLYHSTARMTQTYDHIGFFARKARLPDHGENDIAGTGGPDGYDYGVFAYADLFAKALHGAARWLDLAEATRKTLVKRFEYDVSDHLPIWVRLPIPGA